MKYSDFQDEGTDGDATQFEPTPWGSRQRVMPRRGFKAAVSVIAPLPATPVQTVTPEPSCFVAEAPLHLESSPFIMPIVRERDLPTWRVPKLPPPPSARRFDTRRLRLWLPIASLVAVLVLAFFGTRSNATHIAAALTAEPHAITMATIEAPAPIAVAPTAVAPVAVPPAPVVAPVVAEPSRVAKRVALVAPVVKQSARSSMRASSSKRPRLDVNFATPLGDLAKPRR